jgi:hypothetical protein
VLYKLDGDGPLFRAFVAVPKEKHVDDDTGFG